MAKKPVDYKQYDAKWASIDYSAKGETNTIKSAGCGVTCAAMVIATLKDKNVTPVTTAKWSKARGYKIKNQGTAYSYFKPQLSEYGINCTMLNSINVYKNRSALVHKTVANELKKGNWIISVMGPGNWTKGGHYVLAYAYEDGYIYINDSASTHANRLKAKIEDWQYEVKYYWKVDVPVENTINIDTKAAAIPVKPSVAKTYTVVAGDTLNKISLKLLGKLNRYNEIMTLNNLSSTVIKIGQTLKIPIN